jgi:putative phosphoribosyl transferase
MYFKSRADAGRQLADNLTKYKAQNIVVVALGEGSSIVAAQIAMKLHANLLLYLIKDIYLPGENQAIAALSSGGTFGNNDYFSPGEIEELSTEYHSYIEQKRIEANHELNVLLGRDGEINKDLLRHRVVIVVSDGLSTGFSMQMCINFLKTIATKKVVAATPLASVQAVDRMHIIADEICCLSVTDNYMGTDHYYEDNTLPPVDSVLKIMRNITLNWERVPQGLPDTAQAS